MIFPFSGPCRFPQVKTDNIKPNSLFSLLKMNDEEKHIAKFSRQQLNTEDFTDINLSSVSSLASYCLDKII